MHTTAITPPSISSPDKAVVPAWAAKGWSTGQIRTSWEYDLDLMLGKIWGVVYDHQYHQCCTPVSAAEEYDEFQEDKVQHVELVESATALDIKPAAINNNNRPIAVDSGLESTNDDHKRKRSSDQESEVEKEAPEHQRRRKSESDLRVASASPTLRRRSSESDIDYEVDYTSIEFPSPSRVLYTKNSILADHLRDDHHFLNQGEETEGGIEEEVDDDDVEYVEFADAGCGMDDEDYQERMDMNSEGYQWEQRILEDRPADVRRRSSYSGYEPPLETIGESPEPEEEYIPRFVQSMYL